jgi:hypothetical protein
LGRRRIYARWETYDLCSAFALRVIQACLNETITSCMTYTTTEGLERLDEVNPFQEEKYDPSPDSANVRGFTTQELMRI